jgi:hypothetical protein
MANTIYGIVLIVAGVVCANIGNAMDPTANAMIIAVDIAFLKVQSLTFMWLQHNDNI